MPLPWDVVAYGATAARGRKACVSGCQPRAPLGLQLWHKVVSPRALAAGGLIRGQTYQETSRVLSDKISGSIPQPMCMAGPWPVGKGHFLWNVVEFLGWDVHWRSVFQVHEYMGSKRIDTPNFWESGGTLFNT